jgi:hypothetical protein
MKKLALVASLSFLVGAGAARAQDAASGDADEERSEPRRAIRVLENPYDLASFYRSSQGNGYFDEGGSVERYPIAGFYRSRPASARGYSRFWTNGYSSVRRRGVGAAIPFANSIGENGDLFLMAPTFLAPVGPLTGVFFSFGP